jgi:formamidopyrimidine-DNA glycosylase
MFEIPEILVLSRQIDKAMRGKTIREGRLGNSPHKFVWYNRSHEEFTELAKGKSIGACTVHGRWLAIGIDPGYSLVLGEVGGKVLYHESGAILPAKYHLLLEFDDGSAFSVFTQMWGGMELYERGEELKNKYIDNPNPTPADKGFNPAYFKDLVTSCVAAGKRSVKSLLTQEQTIPGLGNSVAQDIMFRAGLHPRRELSTLSETDVGLLYDAVVDLVEEITEKGGRNDETDLFGKPGGYVRLMYAKAAGNPCPRCGTTVQKIQYLGGACYFCPKCQK